MILVLSTVLRQKLNVLSVPSPKVILPVFPQNLPWGDAGVYPIVLLLVGYTHCIPLSHYFLMAKALCLMVKPPCLMAKPQCHYVTMFQRLDHHFHCRNQQVSWPKAAFWRFQPAFWRFQPAFFTPVTQESRWFKSNCCGKGVLRSRPLRISHSTCEGWDSFNQIRC